MRPILALLLLGGCATAIPPLAPLSAEDLAAIQAVQAIHDPTVPHYHSIIPTFARPSLITTCVIPGISGGTINTDIKVTCQ